MALEEPDTATAGTATPDHDGGPPWRRHPVALGLSIAALTVWVAIGVAVLVGGHDGSRSAQEAVAKRDASQVLGADDERDANPAAESTTASSVVPPPTPTAPVAPTADPSEPSAPGPSAPPPPSVPGVPLVSIGAPGPNGCPAWWTVDNGGSPLVHYIVTRESAPAPPGTDGVEIGTALVVEKTTATTATVDVGGTIHVSAENVIGSGPTSATLSCR